jgi:hypothetical protein
MRNSVIFLILCAIALSGCGLANRSLDLPLNTATRAPAELASNTPITSTFAISRSSDPTRLDCIPGTGACTELKIQGDAPYALPNGTASPFSGYADPSLRKDPQSGTLWLSYSWPNYHLVDGRRVPSVDVHLAKSTDGGSSWTFVKSLWPSTPISNPANPSQNGFLENEASNLLPVLEGNTVTWYAVRLNYFMPDIGGANALSVNSFHIRVFKAASPEVLTDAP